MSARANAPVFQLHPSATGAALTSPSQIPVAPVPASHGFTPANAAQLMPNPPPMPAQILQQQQQAGPPPPPQGPTQAYHQRTDSGSSQGRRRTSSFSRRRADPRSRSSVPPQLSQPLPKIQAASAKDLISGARTAPVPDIPSSLHSEGLGPGYEPYPKRSRDDGYVRASRSDGDARSPGPKSPDRLSQHSATGSIKSMKKEAEEVERASAMPSPPAPTAP